MMGRLKEDLPFSVVRKRGEHKKRVAYLILLDRIQKWPSFCSLFAFLGGTYSNRGSELTKKGSLSRVQSLGRRSGLSFFN